MDYWRPTTPAFRLPTGRQACLAGRQAGFPYSKFRRSDGKSCPLQQGFRSWLFAPEPNV
jgi:hypothetical protein